MSKQTIVQTVQICKEKYIRMNYLASKHTPKREISFWKNGEKRAWPRNVEKECLRNVKQDRLSQNEKIHKVFSESIKTTTSYLIPNYDSYPPQIN